MPPFAPIGSDDEVDDNATSVTPLTEINQRQKRRIAQLEEQISQLQRKPLNTQRSDRTLGRAVLRIISLYDPLADLVAERDRRQALLELEDELEDDEEEHESAQDNDRRFRGYQAFVYYLPIIKQKLAVCETMELSLWLSTLRKGGDAARSDDTSSMRIAVAHWLRNATPPLDPESRSNRGISHVDTGRLLRPIEYDWEDESVRTSIQRGDGDYLVTSDSWPAFLYPRAKYDPMDQETGLFQSSILIKAYKFIFTSPSSAKETSIDDNDENQAPEGLRRKKAKVTATKKNIASLIGLHRVTPRSIAYIAVQLRVALSDASYWMETDGNFNYVDFYNNIVDHFEAPPGPIAKAKGDELLAWWSQKVFKNAPVQRIGNGHNQDSSVFKLAAARIARETAD